MIAIITLRYLTGYWGMNYLNVTYYHASSRRNFFDTMGLADMTNTLPPDMLTTSPFIFLLHDEYIYKMRLPLLMALCAISATIMIFSHHRVLPAPRDSADFGYAGMFSTTRCPMHASHIRCRRKSHRLSFARRRYSPTRRRHFGEDFEYFTRAFSRADMHRRCNATPPKFFFCTTKATRHTEDTP